MFASAARLYHHHGYTLSMTIQLLSRLSLILLLLLGSTLSHSQQTLQSPTTNRSSINDLLAEEPDDDLSDILSQQDEFLPVNEAYKLEVSVENEQLVAEWIIADKYYLYGEQFKFFAIQGSQQNAIKAQLPVGMVQYDEVFKKNVEKHYYNARVILERAQLPQDQTSTLSITSQGCADAGLCYPPETQFFSFDPVNNTVTPTTAPATTSTSLNGTPPPIANSAWLPIIMILFAMAGGLILNLMPCVFPVLSIKALSIANAGQDSRTQKRHGWSYTIGVMATFLLIAITLIIVRKTGEAVGWGFQLQSPGFITLLIYLFFAMGLSLSGYITFGTRFMGTGQELTQGNDLKHSFFTGALAAIVASPCTAPLMAPALGYALTQPTHIALIIFAALGFGMASPFLLLSHLPKLGEWLPQPGAWMETLKQALAFPLYITAIWLAWVLGRQVSSDAIALVLIGAIAIVFAAWIHNHQYTLSKTITFAAVLCVALIAWQNNQPRTHTDVAEGPWENYDEQRLSDLRQEGQPVFINLTADWCITCLANEKLVLTESTLTQMQTKGIHLIKGDWTNYDPNITRLLESYGRGGVPLYLLFPANSTKNAQVLPQILTPSLFQEKIDNI